MSRLRVRQPTGQVAWPLILVEGAEKCGKSFASYSLSADPRVGRTFVLDLGEGTADEYKALGPYEVIDHNGTYADMLDQIGAACALPQADGKPNVVVIDSATALWELIKDWTEHRARNSTAGRKKLEADPDAEIDVAMNLWNDARERWNRVVNLLRKWDGIGILICRARETAKVGPNGKPVTGQTDYTVEAHKSTPFAVKAQVRMTKPHTATLVAIHKLGAHVPLKGTPLPDENPLGHLVWDVLGAGTGPSHIVDGSIGLTVGVAKQQLLAVLDSRGVPQPRDAAIDIWSKHGPGDTDEVSAETMAGLIAAAEGLASARPHLVKDVKDGAA